MQLQRTGLGVIDCWEGEIVIARDIYLIHRSPNHEYNFQHASRIVAVKLARISISGLTIPQSDSLLEPIAKREA
jgi:hypothetical protein